MKEYTKNSAPRLELRARIVDTAVKSFSAQGIKSVTMDDIAGSLGISKRTLYEVFPDKETLLEESILKEQESTALFAKEVLKNSANVLEVLLKLYQRSIEKFHATNKKFFEDIKKYPRAYELIKRNHNRNLEEAVNFFKEGVKQGIFRDDVNFAVVSLLVHEQLNLLIDSDLSTQFSFLEVYESIMFTFLRGISTKKGADELDLFIHDYRKKQIPHDETKNNCI